MILQYVMFLFLLFSDITLSDVSDLIPGHEVKKRPVRPVRSALNLTALCQVSDIENFRV